METINEKSYRLFPGELVWSVFWPFVLAFFVQEYNPIHLLNLVVFLLLSIYYLWLIFRVSGELKQLKYRLLNGIFSWLLNILDLVLNYTILQDNSLLQNGNYIFFRSLHYQVFSFYIVPVMLFKIAISTIAFVCMERTSGIGMLGLQNMTFWELYRFPNNTIKNISVYQLVRSMLSKDAEQCIVDKTTLNAYYTVFYKSFYMVIALFIFIFVNNLLLLMVEPLRKYSFSFPVFLFLCGLTVLLPAGYYHVYRKAAS